MPKLKDMSIEDLEHFIEQKLLEIICNPDSGLQLKEEFKKKLEQRLKKQCKSIPHQGVLKRIAYGRVDKRGSRNILLMLSTYALKLSIKLSFPHVLSGNPVFR